MAVDAIIDPSSPRPRGRPEPEQRLHSAAPRRLPPLQTPPLLTPRLQPRGEKAEFTRSLDAPVAVSRDRRGYASRDADAHAQKVLEEPAHQERAFGERVDEHVLVMGMRAAADGPEPVERRGAHACREVPVRPAADGD